jgi:hypothetical protein
MGRQLSPVAMAFVELVREEAKKLVADHMGTVHGSGR